MSENTASKYWNERVYFWGLRRRDIFLFEIYAATMFLGTIYGGFLDRSKIANYFGNSKNLINILFVKKGWFWTTVAYFSHIWYQKNKQLGHKLIIRYVLATLWWFLVTQWFVGPSLIDRAFALTGGTCVDFDVASITFHPKTAVHCKTANGFWTGGHDLSGHVFLLTHSSLFMLAENFDYFVHHGIKSTSTKFLTGLLCLWWWMLFVTTAYYHTTLEKFTGFFSGILEWAVVYVLCSKVPFVSSILGSPEDA
ncbi:ER membrane CoA pyrophosphatase (FIT) family lipid storage protein Fit1 [Schizosaccharomyces osmophilus]|uniref:ER membrane CoA pyrophosphatase (FIT) family lipid storage protein Fit1 n=1 Tax=Schizosaccharomyces osmophilus TaxID=2545709 RepID=A0AAE9WCX7_9SCHI|nr:ER membrane CoA pyrophosphatase (FIT) family lipid storage protein Fit1 [Schizosaccharomyces osmophilus]WBW73949.1 ER membrane CoA pyrophosphatase (FIT) family lipid storage protein Fit1 [Schizosaccharomyces osmophilus]